MTTPRRAAHPTRRGLVAAVLSAAAICLTAFGNAAADGPRRATAAGPRPTPATVVPAGALGVTFVKGGFDDPIFVTHAPGDGRLFVVERTGRIKILTRVSGHWTLTGTFLNVANKIEDGYNEQGLLGLAFPPDYASSGRFYIDYTRSSNGDIIVAEYRRQTYGKGDPNSGRVVLQVAHHDNLNHNGGWIGFKAQYLYIATGDGGGGGDTPNNAQRLDRLLGKILRIDPRDPDGGGPRHYSVPSDNPFVGRAGLDVIWAYGLRNPWRDGFDRATGDLWIGDVGQDVYEEVDHHGTARGTNFGWHLVEGRHRYPSGSLCTSNCKTLPVVEYSHTYGGCAVVGGYVSRRSGAAQYGRYIFGDDCSGKIWSIPAGFSGGSLPAPYSSGLTLSSFGEGPGGRIFAVDLAGSIYVVTGT